MSVSQTMQPKAGLYHRNATRSSTSDQDFNAYRHLLAGVWGKIWTFRSTEATRLKNLMINGKPQGAENTTDQQLAGHCRGLKRKYLGGNLFGTNCNNRTWFV